MDMQGKTVLVTGANSGIGLEACVKMAGMGAQVVMVARDSRKGEAALADVRARSGSKTVSLLLCNFASQAAIRSLAAEFLARYPRLDVLVNNAGLASVTQQRSVDGFELTFAVNHLGYFLLTNLLLDRLMLSAPARVVSVASRAHRRVTLDLDNLQSETGKYSSIQAYGRSKLCNVLFSNELARRLAGKGVTANCLHPGVVASNIWENASPPFYLRPLLAVAKRFLMITTEQGAETIIQLATGSSIEGQTGGYYEDQRRVEPARLARDPQLASRLWDASARLVQPANA